MWLTMQIKIQCPLPASTAPLVLLGSLDFNVLPTTAWRASTPGWRRQPKGSSAAGRQVNLVFTCLSLCPGCSVRSRQTVTWFLLHNPCQRGIGLSCGFSWLLPSGPLLAVGVKRLRGRPRMLPLVDRGGWGVQATGPLQPLAWRMQRGWLQTVPPLPPTASFSELVMSFYHRILRLAGGLHLLVFFHYACGR